MNERIKELEAQCWEHDQSWTGVGQRIFNSKKFAQLIVRECMEQIDDGNSDHAGGNIDAINRIKEHFGVEE